VLGEDFIARWQQKRLEGKVAVTQMRWLSCVIGSIAVGASILNSFISGNLIERCFKVVNLFTAPLFTLFFLALFVPWSNSFGAWCGLIASIVTAIAVAYSAELGLGPGLGIAWIVPSSLVVGVLIGVVASAVAYLGTSRKPRVTE
jgi:SSS family solute:Na+ symporter